MTKRLTYVSKQRFIERIGRLVFLIGLIWGAAGAMPSTAYGQSPEWSKPVMLSEQDTFAWFPEVTADLAGGVHVIWASGRQVPENKSGGYDTVVYCQPTPAGCPEPREVAALEQVAGEFNTRPAAVVDSQGQMHMLWRGETVIYHTSTSLVEPAPARVWTSPRRVSGSNTAYYLNIAQDRKGVLHAVWSENMPQNEFEFCPGCSDIFYRQSTDLGKTWSAPVDLSNTDWSSEKPHVVIGPDEVVYVVWEEGHDFYVGEGEPTASMAIASLDGGLTWQEPTTFIFAGDTPQSVAAGVDGQGKLVVVWQQVKGQGVFYQISTDQGQSWSIPKQIPGLVTRSIYNDLDDYDMALDSAGHLHLVLVGRDVQQVEAAANQPKTIVPDTVYHLRWNGTTWSEASPVFVASGGDLPEWPRIAVSNGNQLQVVWFVRDKKHIHDSDGGLYEVWYAQGFSSAPAVAPIAWPTPVPSPTPVVVDIPTAELAPTPAPTPVPTLDPNLGQIPVPSGATNSIYSDNDEVLLLAKSLLPSLLVIVIVIVGIRFWRQ